MSLVVAGKYNYQAFGWTSVNQQSCANSMRQSCAPAQQGVATIMFMDNTPDNANQTVAAFLITRCVDNGVEMNHFLSDPSLRYTNHCRGPYSYIGWGWESDDRDWNDIFYLQVRMRHVFFAWHYCA